MSFKYPQPMKLFSFYCRKQEGEKNFYSFDEKMFPVYDSHSTQMNSPLNLLEGVSEHFKKPFSPINISHWDVLAYIHNTVDMSLQQITDHADVVCYHGFLRDLALLPFGINFSYSFVAFMYDGIVFIEKVETSTNPISSKDIEKEYMQKKLNEICTTIHNRKTSTKSSSNIFDEAYYVAKTRVFETPNSTIKVMFTKEVNAIDHNSRSKHNNFMELRLCPGNFKHLLNGNGPYKAWAGNYIAGNEWIVLGITNNSKPSLKKVKVVRVADLESKLPYPVPKIMEYVGRLLESIIRACKKHPKKYIIITDKKFSLYAVDEEAMKSFYYSRPTPAFLKVFPEQSY